MAFRWTNAARSTRRTDFEVKLLAVQRAEMSPRCHAVATINLWNINEPWLARKEKIGAQLLISQMLHGLLPAAEIAALRIDVIAVQEAREFQVRSC